jgi:hypothetical protein
VTIKKRHNLLPFQAGGAASTLFWRWAREDDTLTFICREEDC